MMGKTEIAAWLDTLADDAAVAIDDGGLMLMAFADGERTGAHLEIGGVSDDDDDSGTDGIGDVFQSIVNDTPEGMITTIAGRVLKDDGYGQLVKALDEAYEVAGHVDISIVGLTPFRMIVGDHLASDGSIRLGDDLIVMPDCRVAGMTGDAQSALIRHVGGDTVGLRERYRFTICGKAATVDYENVLNDTCDK